jgi:hypothetical protein
MGPAGAWRGERGGKASLWAVEHLLAGCIPKNEFFGGRIQVLGNTFSANSTGLYMLRPQ